MTKIDFYKLPRAVQDGLLDAFRGHFTPVPILKRPGTRHPVLGWLGVSAGAALLLVALFVTGFGNVDSRFALHPIATSVVYIVLAAISGMSLILALARRAS